MSINLDQPNLPNEIISFGRDVPGHDYFDTVKVLWREVCDELLDPTYAARSHNVGTYDQGCRGPLCRKALREHPRRRASHGIQLQMREERAYDPVLEFFYTVLKFRIRKYQHDLVKELAQ